MILTPFARDVIKAMETLDFEWRFSKYKGINIPALATSISASEYKTVTVFVRGEEYPLSFFERIFIWNAIKRAFQKFSKLHRINAHQSDWI